GYEPALGARPLRRVVQREIEDAISERILSGDIQNSQDILVDYISGEFTFVSTDRAQSVVS
ncbi:MAG: hypothetical protein RL460_212, partial [Actinomycetota bacterium]